MTYLVLEQDNKCDNSYTYQLSKWNLIVSSGVLVTRLPNDNEYQDADEDINGARRLHQLVGLV